MQIAAVIFSALIAVTAQANLGMIFFAYMRCNLYNVPLPRHYCITPAAWVPITNE